jgi:hypothetical protein
MVKTMATLIGLNLGQQRDPTAICIAETERRPPGRSSRCHFLVRHLERLADHPFVTGVPVSSATLGAFTTMRLQRP